MFGTSHTDSLAHLTPHLRPQICRERFQSLPVLEVLLSIESVTAFGFRSHCHISGTTLNLPRVVQNHAQYPPPPRPPPFCFRYIKISKETLVFILLLINFVSKLHYRKYVTFRFHTLQNVSRYPLLKHVYVSFFRKSISAELNQRNTINATRPNLNQL
jgi:hypothetical protein